MKISAFIRYRKAWLAAMIAATLAVPVLRAAGPADYNSAGDYGDAGYPAVGSGESIGIRPISFETLPATREAWIDLIDQRVAAHRLESERREPSGPPTRFASMLVDRGQVAFERACTECHDAERSLSKRKSYGDWLATVQRMAAKDGADVPSGDIEPIAAYLASVASPAGSEAEGVSDPEDIAATAQASLNATISAVWRGSNGERALENPDFFVDAWFGGEWRPRGPLAARVTACTSCHSDYNPSRGFSVELVEASATLDLRALVCGDRPPECERPDFKAEIKAGRFVVPFGAFAAMSHPGVYRTVTNPLMFNMGRRVGATGPLQPVLPAPYADEGVDLHLSVPVPCDVTATLDIYGVNGLQGPGPGLFNASRSYVDNNREPAFGGRATVGTRFFRFGGSAMAGNLADAGVPSVQYKLTGVDVTARIPDLARFYFEYAIREDHSIFVPGDDNQVYGIVIEAEVQLFDNLGLLARYDTLEHRHSSFGDSSLQRFTYGFNALIPGGSRIAVNHEHWIFTDHSDVDVIGARWTAAF